ncbi:hypothetical protein HDU97_005375 [Phlyctochytrium planicorne]|nr:hypothetical protein HDU97_005375 [Phlyctochytrium planicorne]
MQGYASALANDHIELVRMIPPQISQNIFDKSEMVQWAFIESCIAHCSSEKAVNELLRLCSKVEFSSFLADRLAKTIPLRLLRVYVGYSRTILFYASPGNVNDEELLRQMVLSHIRLIGPAASKKYLLKLVEKCCKDRTDDAKLFRRFFETSFWNLELEVESDSRFQTFFDVVRFFFDILEADIQYRNSFMLDVSKISLLPLEVMQPSALCSAILDLTNGEGGFSVGQAKPIVYLLFDEGLMCGRNHDRAQYLLLSAIDESKEVAPWLKPLARFVKACLDCDLKDAVGFYPEMAEHFGRVDWQPRQDFHDVVDSGTIVAVSKLLCSQNQLKSTVEWIKGRNLRNWRTSALIATYAAFVATDHGSEADLEQMLDPRFCFSERALTPFVFFPSIHEGTLLLWAIYLSNAVKVRQHLDNPKLPSSFVRDHALKVALTTVNDRRFRYYPKKAIQIVNIILCDPRADPRLIFEDSSGKSFAGECPYECLQFLCGQLSPKSISVMHMPLSRSIPLLFLERQYSSRLRLDDYWLVRHHIQVQGK